MALIKCDGISIAYEGQRNMICQIQKLSQRKTSKIMIGRTGNGSAKSELKTVTGDIVRLASYLE